MYIATRDIYSVDENLKLKDLVYIYYLFLLSIAIKHYTRIICYRMFVL